MTAANTGFRLWRSAGTGRTMGMCTEEVCHVSTYTVPEL